MTDHRKEAAEWLQAAAIDDGDPFTSAVSALIGIGHALLAQDHNRCTATRGHANGHHYPADKGVTT